MTGHWYVARDGETFGPFTFERICEGAREGELRRNDFVWHEGMSDWLAAGDVSDIWQPHSTPPPPATVAPSNEQQGTAAIAAKDGAPANVPTSGESEIQRNALPRKGFILRHWRGELTLAQAYWGVGMLLTLLAIWAGNAFGAWLGQASLSPAGFGIAFASFVSFLCAMTIWQLVGIWRAAGKHIR